MWLYEEAEEASIDLREYVSGYTKERGIERLGTEGLGEDAFGSRGAYPADEGGQPFLVYAWRVGNLNLLISIQGPITVDDARGLADKMNSRAVG